MSAPALEISWADHWEDVRLWRVLARLDPGFYVDVGAADPSSDSVTKAVYERGWSGLDIEPNPYFAERLRRERTRDQVEEVAIGTTRGGVRLHVITDRDGRHTGLSTVRGGIAERHRDEGNRVAEVETEMLPLSDLLRGSSAEDPDRFHFLKVDVEGAEADVLQSSDLVSFRPLVIVVEARAPRREEDSYSESEAILDECRYIFAADDGLNRWYVRSEDDGVAGLLRPEINPLTDGKPRRWWEVEREHELIARMDELDAAARASSAEAEAMRVRVEEVVLENADVRARLELVYGSRSWRLTRPLRAIQTRVRRRPRD